MILSSLFMLIISSTLTLYLAPTPIILGLNILIMAFLLSMSVAISMSSWYAFLIFLIYIGGMLVMFAYFLAIAPNQQMTSNNSMYMMFVVILTTSFLIYTQMYPHIKFFDYQEMSNLYLMTNGPLLIILASILLFTMIVVVKLTNRSKGPLRPFN